MLSGILRSDIAIAANIAIMRAFVQVREYLVATSSLSVELKELRARVDLLQLQQEEDLGALNDLRKMSDRISTIFSWPSDNWQKNWRKRRMNPVDVSGSSKQAGTITNGI